LQYSYIPGIVSAERKIKAFGYVRHVLNVVGFPWKGSSGGGAYDKQGSLLGICSFLVRAPGQIMFVHIDEVRDFLNEKEIKYHTL
jgi:hypothetical protein